MSFCQSQQQAPAGGSTPPPVSAAPTTSTAIPLPQTHKGADGVTLNGPQAGGWRDAVNPYVRAMIPPGMQTILGAAGMEGMPAVGNKPAPVSGMPTPTSSPAMMTDPATNAMRSGGGNSSAIMGMIKNF